MTTRFTLKNLLTWAVVGAAVQACSTTKNVDVVAESTDSSKAKTTKAASTDAATAAAVAEIVENFRRVYFEFDSSTLTPSTRDALLANTEILRRHRTVSVEVQGHCDDRGTTEYNLSLGDRRARAIRDYLVKAGVSPQQLTAISFGKERPIQVGDGEPTWSKNRRAEFRVLVGTKEPLMAVRGTAE